MNKYTLLICTAALAAVLTACDNSSGGAEPNSAVSEPQETATADIPLCGGWQQAESPEITPEIKEMVNKAFIGYDGVGYIPVTYLASQVVAGTNHAVLCRACGTQLDTEEYYAIVKIYQNLKNEYKVLNILNSPVKTNISSETNLAGGWRQASSPVVTDELRGMFAGAFKPPADAEYKPLALLSTQVVSGMNYCFFCEKTTDKAPNASGYAFVYLYRDAQGHTEITDIVHFEGDAKQ